MNTRLLLLSLAIAIEQDAVTSFSTTTTPMPARYTHHHLYMAAGMGMGTKQKKNGYSKGMGKKSSKDNKKNGASFDVAKSLIKSEKLYDELLTESSKAHAAAEYEDDIVDITTEYVVAARAKPGTSSGAASDWIPVAQVCIVRPVHGEDKDGQLDDSVHTAVSYYCREIHHSACRASHSTFQSLPRNQVEYSVEPYSSFVKYVYEEVIEGKSSSGNFEENGASIAMTKSKARQVLGLDIGCKDPTLIKQTYKKLMFELVSCFGDDGLTGVQIMSLIYLPFHSILTDSLMINAQKKKLILLQKNFFQSK